MVTLGDKAEAASSLTLLRVGAPFKIPHVGVWWSLI